MTAAKWPLPSEIAPIGQRTPPGLPARGWPRSPAAAKATCSRWRKSRSNKKIQVSTVPPGNFGMIDHMAGRYSFALFGSLAYSAFLLIGSAGLTRAEERQEAPSGREQTVLAEKFTAERLWVWQKRLGLQDWRLSVAVVPASELKPKTLGNIHWDLGKKTAMIHVLDPGDYHMPMKDMLKDMEFTVVDRKS